MSLQLIVNSNAFTSQVITNRKILMEIKTNFFYTIEPQIKLLVLGTIPFPKHFQNFPGTN